MYIYILVFLRSMFINIYIYLPLIMYVYFSIYQRKRSHHDAETELQPLRSKEPSLPNVVSLTVPPPIVEGEGGEGGGWSGRICFLLEI